MEDLILCDLSEETQEVFRVQGIDITCLDSITDDDIKILIPDTKLRDRIKFREAVKKWKQDTQAVHCNTPSMDTCSVDSDFSLLSNTSCESPSSHVQHPSLEEILTCTNGKIALNAIKNKRSLASHSRNCLVKGIVEYYIKNYNSMKKDDFQYISKEIVKFCPSECQETYYVPSRPYGQGQYMPAKGKLTDRYYNQILTLRSFGVLPSKKRKLNVDSSLVEKNVDHGEEGIESQLWLKFNKEPWTQIETKWQESCHFRKATTYGSALNKVKDIFKEWPSLRQSLGYRLIEIDFNSTFQDKGLKLIQKWEPFVKKAIPILQKDIKNHETLLSILEEDPTEDSRDLVILTLLAAKIKPTSKVRDTAEKKKFCKTSIQESREFFILHVTNHADVEQQLKNRRDAYERKGLTCQPCVIAVGATVQEVHDFLVVLDDIKYQVGSILKAVDICFKSYMVFNACYPLECEQIWLFIQKYFYEIDLKGDKKLSYVSAFMAELM